MSKVEVGMVVFANKSGKEYKVIAVENGIVTIQMIAGSQKYNMKEESFIKNYTIISNNEESEEYEEMVEKELLDLQDDNIEERIQDARIILQEYGYTVIPADELIEIRMELAELKGRLKQSQPTVSHVSKCQCGKEISKEAAKYSAKHFGKEFCFSCQAKAKAEKRAQEPVDFKCRCCGEIIHYATRKEADESRRRAKAAGLEYANYHKKCANALLTQKNKATTTQPRQNSGQQQQPVPVKFGAPIQQTDNIQKNTL